MTKLLIFIHSIILAVCFTLGVNSELFAEDNDKKDRAEEHFQKALVYYEKGDNELAIKQLKTALKFDSKLAKAYNQLALIYMSDGTVYGRSKATYEMEKAIKLEPQNIEFLFNDAQLNLKKGFTRYAEKRLKKIIELAPQSHLAYYQLAQLKEEEG